MHQITRDMSANDFQRKTEGKRLYIGVACTSEQTFKCLQDPYASLSFESIRDSVYSIVHTAFIRMSGGMQGNSASGVFAARVGDLCYRRSLVMGRPSRNRRVRQSGGTAWTVADNPPE